MIRLDERYLRHWDERLPPWQDFDPSDRAHVEAASGVLLEQFAGGDIEAFALLSELAGPVLHDTARELVDATGAATSAVRLVEAFRRQLFLERGRDGAPAAQEHFLSFARDSLGRLARHATGLAAERVQTPSDDRVRGAAGGRRHPGEGLQAYK
ncbi:MAG: hypothetical protein H6825_06815 [Planctomycetes bacterium]|nr:hypothetical protein [Planctomycetota bacterium]